MQQPLPREEICLLSFDINYAKISTREGQKFTDTFYKSNVTYLTCTGEKSMQVQRSFLGNVLFVSRKRAPWCFLSKKLFGCHRSNSER